MGEHGVHDNQPIAPRGTKMGWKKLICRWWRHEDVIFNLSGVIFVLSGLRGDLSHTFIFKCQILWTIPV